MTEPRSDRMLIVSADGHWGGPPWQYGPYIDREFLEDLDGLIDKDRTWREGSLSQRRFSAETLELIDREHAVRSGGERGAWELGRRLAEMDRSGVAAEVLIPGHQETVLPFFSHVSPPASPRHRAAGARAYHRQLADVVAASGSRLAGVADPGPCLDLDETVGELRWVAEHGFVGVAPPGNIADSDLPPLFHPRYEPFWRACSETGLALVVHAGFGFPQGLADGMAAMNSMAASVGTEEMLRMSTLSAPDLSKIRIDEFPVDHPFRVALVQPRRVFWQLMLSGVFDRHPGLKLVFTEIRSDWVPDTVAYLERRFADGHAQLQRSPKEYWEHHVYIAPSSTRRREVELRHEVGIRRFMFGTDYPHPEGTWPNTQDWIKDAFQGVSLDDARLVLGQNALECYGLDAQSLRRVAGRIGPRPEELLGGDAVAPELRAQFHDRAGYLRPAEQVTPATYEAMISEDERGVASAQAVVS